MPTTQDVTLDDIAKLSGVSKSAVSRSLNGKPGISPETRRRVLATAKSLGYSLPRDERQLRLAGVVSAPLDYVAAGAEPPPFTSQLLAGMIAGIHAAGHRLELVTVNYRTQSDDVILESVANKTFDGVCVVAPRMHFSVPDRLAEEGKPVVVVGEKWPGERVSNVYVDIENGCYEAVSHLTRLGHRRIGMITPARGTAGDAGRLQGYQRALSDGGLPPDDALIVFDDPKTSTSSIHAAVKRLLALPDPPTAIFAAGALRSLYAHKCLRDLGVSIPEDISLLGFGWSHAHALLTPSLDSVEVPVAEMGYRAVMLLASITLGHARQPVKEALGTVLAPRSSIAPPSSSKGAYA